MFVEVLFGISILLNILLGILAVLLREEIRNRETLTREEIEWLRRRLMRIKEIESR